MFDHALDMIATGCQAEIMRARQQQKSIPIVVSYEPVFGWIVAILGGILMGAVALAPSNEGKSHAPIFYLVALAAQMIVWGVTQIVGYRKAQRAGTTGKACPPLMGTAVGCVFLGLMFALAASLFYVLAPDQRLYGWLAAIVSAALLVLGAIAGVRQGTWRGQP